MSLLHRNDARGRHAPSWYAHSAAPFPELPPLRGEARADVCVIGGGFTGLSTALHLAERGAQVTLVEAHRVGWGASGRNGGQVAVGQRLWQEEIERMLGPDDARAAWEIGRDAARLVRALIARHGIDCAWRDGILHPNHRRRFDGPARAHVERMRKVYGYEGLEWLEPDEMRAALDARGYHGGYRDREAGHLHPLNYARGLARAAMTAGARLHETTEALAIEDGAVRLEDGILRAETIVVACNGYLGRLLPEAAARVLPINNFIIATEPLPPERVRAIIPGGEAVADSRFVVNYFRFSEDGRMLFGGGESYGDAFPRDIKGYVRRRMLKVLPQLADARIDFGWGGTLGITMTRLPFFAEVRPGVFNASGYSGSGVAMGTMAGQLLAEALNGDRRRFDVMARLPAPPFPGGALLRRPTLVAAMLFARLRDML
ncbi:NAD(P)/FAD-dependent oxidoreductase [Oceanicella actignis]|uniref:NAD(P)/FAD-dependent oxidoreductase n=1 Tax=Oceanicella actignis TaxID=1189325 RepID=UPI0011E868B3|nr:FAD-binding oxidoreductase [Oceanicella actignis]TYO90053.1 gamma-glutamylputrescine oxidase [Oceanicella actignis]